MSSIPAPQTLGIKLTNLWKLAPVLLIILYPASFCDKKSLFASFFLVWYTYLARNREQKRIIYPCWSPARAQERRHPPWWKLNCDWNWTREHVSREIHDQRNQ